MVIHFGMDFALGRIFFGLDCSEITEKNWNFFVHLFDELFYSQVDYFKEILIKQTPANKNSNLKSVFSLWSF